MKTGLIRQYFYLLLTTQILFVVRIGYTLIHDHHLPEPFFYDPSDTFMDFYSINLWAFDDERYRLWGSIYPILAFVLGRLTTSDTCELSSIDAYELRDCSLVGILLLTITYVASIVLLATHITKSESFKRSKGISFLLCFLLLFTMPGLFAIERGNYIIYAFFFLSTLSVLGETQVLGGIALGLAICIKQYLLVLLFPALINWMKWRLLATVFVTLIVINLLGVLMLHEENYWMLIRNMLGFMGEAEVSFVEKMWYPTSINTWSKLLNSKHMSEKLSDNVRDYLDLFIQTGRYIFTLSPFIVILYDRVKKEIVPGYVQALLILCALFIGIDSLGGYVLLLMLPYLATLVSRNPQILNNHFVLLCLVVLLTPLDFCVGPSSDMRPTTSFLTGEEVEVLPTLTILSYLRPLALIGFELYLMFYTYRRLRSSL